jgi:hypothetical protein
LAGFKLIHPVDLGIADPQSCIMGASRPPTINARLCIGNSLAVDFVAVVCGKVGVGAFWQSKVFEVGLFSSANP